VRVKTDLDVIVVFDKLCDFLGFWCGVGHSHYLYGVMNTCYFLTFVGNLSAWSLLRSLLSKISMTMTMTFVLSRDLGLSISFGSHSLEVCFFLFAFLRQRH